MDYTGNLELNKPGQEEFYNVDDFNDNFDKLDVFAGDVIRAFSDLPDSTPTLEDFEDLQAQVNKKADKTQIPTTLPANGGRSDTATKLQTARRINGVAFDGSIDINISANATGGNAATATKLQTARRINGVAFDGSADISISAAANGGNAATVGGLNPMQILASIPNAGWSPTIQGANNMSYQYTNMSAKYFNFGSLCIGMAFFKCTKTGSDSGNAHVTGFPVQASTKAWIRKISASGVVQSEYFVDRPGNSGTFWLMSASGQSGLPGIALNDMFSITFITIT